MKSSGRPSYRGCNARRAPGIAPCLAALVIVLAGSEVLLPASRSSAQSAAAPRPAEGARRSDVARGRNGMVVSVNPAASDVGLDVLKRGGNAIDAAVATAAALAVTWPAAGNIGGGGYMLIVPAGEGGRPGAVDFRETAPAAATRDMFVEAAGRTPHRRVGVPGTVRGLALAHEKYGKLPWKDLIAPAVKLAGQGFALDGPTATSLNAALAAANQNDFAELHRVYGRPGGGLWRAGDVLVQPELAATLRRIADQGADAFYTGETADRIVAEMKRGRGLITKEDLAAYRPKVRDAIRGTYRGYEVLAVPPSSSGGVTLIETLNQLETFDLKSMGRWSPECLHLMVEAMKRSYRDRARYLGDPDTVDTPAKLTSKDYARQLARGIDRARATPSAALAGDIPIRPEGEHTTHLSVVDRDRNAVSLTYTLESLYGSRVVVPGAGFLLNDEMNDFAWLPGVTDATGRIGTEPNQIAPGKRMLSSMCPTVLRRGGHTVLVTGSPGGRTIINTVACVVVNVVDFDMDVRAAIDAPRLHHQWFPDRIRIEPALASDHPDAIADLRKLGHQIDEPVRQGDAHTIWIDPKSGDLVGAADTRVDGKAAGF